MERNAVLDDLRMHLLGAQQRMKKYADTKRREEFLMGDNVFLKLRPYRQKSLVSRSNQKLAARFYGPYKVLEHIGAVAYRLELPPSSSIHPILHISQLRRAKGVSHSSSLLPPQLDTDLELIVEPKTLLEVCQQQKGSPGENLPCFEATWEDFHLLNSQFLTFHLEDDKVNAFFFGGGGGGYSIFKPQIHFTYSRRRTT